MPASPAADLPVDARHRRSRTRTTGFTAPSRVRALDFVGESWLELSRRPVRTILTGLGVALGIAAVVVTQGLVTTVRFQVSEEFDATLATQVEVRLRSTPGEPGASDVAEDDRDAFPPPSDALQRVDGLSGVEGVAVLRDSEQSVPVGLTAIGSGTNDQAGAVIHGINASGLAAVGATVTGSSWSTWHDAASQRVALIGRITADELGLHEVRPGDVVFLDDLSFTLLGIIEDGGRVPSLANGVAMPATSTASFPMGEDRDRVLTVTAPGAAKDVEAILPVALSPTDPERYVAYARTPSGNLRRAVDSQLQTLALALGAVVIGLGVVSIGNATLTSVLQRISEIGIRRALGARPRHVAVHVILDAALTGAGGALIGVVVGIVVTLAVAAYESWQPVLDPRIPVAALVVGTVVGAVAGLYPAWVASRLEPTEALRRE